jgi:hypothetical protein
MTFGRRILWTRVAIGAVPAITSVPAAHVQRRCAQPPRCKPAAGAKDLRAARDAGLIPERAYCEAYETGKISSQIRH